MEEEARLRAEAMLVQASGAIVEEAGIKPSITVRQGDPVKAVAELLEGARRHRRRWCWARRPRAAPGPLISHFAGAGGGEPALPADHRARRPQRRGAGRRLS